MERNEILISGEAVRARLKRDMIAQMIAEGTDAKEAEEIAADTMRSVNSSPITRPSAVWGDIIMQARELVIENANGFVKQFSNDFSTADTASDDIPSELLPQIIISAAENARYVGFTKQEFHAIAEPHALYVHAYGTLFDNPHGLLIPDMDGGWRVYLFAPFVKQSRHGVICFQFDENGAIGVINPLWRSQPTKHIYAVASAVFGTDERR